MDSADNVYYALKDANQVKVLSRATSSVSVVAGTGTGGSDGDGGPATSAQLSSPSGIAVDTSGTLYIADATNNKIRALGRSCPAGSGLAAGVCVLCRAGTYSPAVGTAACQPCAAGLQSPVGATDCGSGPTVGNINLFAGTETSTPSFSGDNGPATLASLGTPVDLALDAARQVLYIAEKLNNRIRQVNLATNIITTTLKFAPYSATNLTRVSVDAVTGSLYLGAGNQVRREPMSGAICFTALLLTCAHTPTRRCMS